MGCASRFLTNQIRITYDDWRAEYQEIEERFFRCPYLIRVTLGRGRTEQKLDFDVNVDVKERLPYHQSTHK